MTSAATKRYFVLWTNEAGRAIVGEHETEAEARSQLDSLVLLGWPVTHSASIYAADDRQQIEAHLAERVRLVSAAVGRGYWESPEGRAQSDRQREREERDCQEDWAYVE